MAHVFDAGIPPILRLMCGVKARLEAFALNTGQALFDLRFR
jgi:hypothetical protein